MTTEKYKCFALISSYSLQATSCCLYILIGNTRGMEYVDSHAVILNQEQDGCQVVPPDPMSFPPSGWMVLYLTVAKAVGGF
jgi:hypothetical protein